MIDKIPSNRNDPCASPVHYRQPACSLFRADEAKLTSTGKTSSNARTEHNLFNLSIPLSALLPDHLGLLFSLVAQLLGLFANLVPGLFGLFFSLFAGFLDFLFGLGSGNRSLLLGLLPFLGVHWSLDGFRCGAEGVGRGGGG